MCRLGVLFSTPRPDHVSAAESVQGPVRGTRPVWYELYQRRALTTNALQCVMWTPCRRLEATPFDVNRRSTSVAFQRTPVNTVMLPIKLGKAGNIHYVFLSPPSSPFFDSPVSNEILPVPKLNAPGCWTPEVLANAVPIVRVANAEVAASGLGGLLEPKLKRNAAAPGGVVGLLLGFDMPAAAPKPKEDGSFCGAGDAEEVEGNAGRSVEDDIGSGVAGLVAG